MTYQYEFHWPSTHHQKVIVTGTFDGWSESIQLTKDDDSNVFRKVVEIDDKQQIKDKIVFKFIVDDKWTINTAYKHEKNDLGIENNFLLVEDLDVVPHEKVDTSSLSNTVSFSSYDDDIEKSESLQFNENDEQLLNEFDLSNSVQLTINGNSSQETSLNSNLNAKIDKINTINNNNVFHRFKKLFK